jgi:predicted transcriptional regulator
MRQLNVEIPSELYRRLKILAASVDKTMRQLIEEMLSEAVIEWEIKANA